MTRQGVLLCKCIKVLQRFSGLQICIYKPYKDVRKFCNINVFLFTTHFEVPFKCRFCDSVCDSIHMEFEFEYVLEFSYGNWVVKLLFSYI